ncbi:4'-phosphopantetheinyl transferase family protein [Nonomuraea jiangxiensis]|uniref:4'-phosphopantetheinyl transferase EntD (Siderophore biosynthesis) n=1 Tax=Nonomuraea jiangxiensis TaxID=633440 RepID=A0A1G8SDZ3_9ACTN|nr:4'-phosphopantetheinyl transferase superfamily protein [Nonomuraea jiangxiensis]SDJ27417.1 4'-phosphopantetheinyl transferase EntD (siderophore biosynthesis) [Nonomuraea jiangxiensis]
MIEEILPREVVAEEAFGDLDADLFPEEEAVIARAVDKRRKEFATVRACARRALARLGHRPVPLVPGERGAPRWPRGVVGSMTHCVGYRGAAVAAEEAMLTLGLDAEPHAPLPDGVLGAVSLDSERRMLAGLSAEADTVCWDRLLFSAKESVYKAWYPLTATFLEFDEAEIDLRPDGSFAARLLVPGPVVNGAPLTGFRGRWLARDGLALTAIALAAAPGTRRHDPANSAVI